jgi:hypothetical protein
MARSLTGTGLKRQLLSAAASSGTESGRVVFDTPYSHFGLSVELVGTSSQAGLCAAVLYGSVAASTTITTAHASTLCTWSTNSGNTVWNSTGDRAQPVNQVWAVVTDAATSATAVMDVWMAAVP